MTFHVSTLGAYILISGAGPDARMVPFAKGDDHVGTVVCPAKHDLSDGLTVDSVTTHVGQMQYWSGPRGQSFGSKNRNLRWSTVGALVGPKSAIYAS